MSARVRAPQLIGRGGWLNTGGVTVTLAQLRGKIVLLDFWTFACANCLHVLDELRDLERDYADVLVVIGVHSPKFAHESSHEAVAAAVARYSVDHPVLDDPDLHLWQQYAVHAWPTLVLIDPAGYVVAQAAGEGQAGALGVMIDALIAEFDATGSLRRGDGPYVAPASVGGDLRFPAKAARSGDSLLVADAGHNQIVELTLDGRTVRRRIGSGDRGRLDGPAAIATFAEPGAVALLPAGVARSVGFEVVVADTANHLLRGIRLIDGAVVATIDLSVGLADVRTITGAVPTVLSPWDVVWWPEIEQVVVACAGVHLLVGWSPSAKSASILAGTTVEGLKDGPALDGWLAQPSGLAPAGDRLWFVDAETSSLRTLSLDGQLRTYVGEGLFDFGFVDGSAARARLQHPLGLAVLADATIAIADTYNGAIRRYDPATDSVSTLVTGLIEPSDVIEIDDELVVVESGAHRVGRRLIAVAVPVPATEPMASVRPVTDLAPGRVELAVVFDVPAGRKLDESEGPSVRLSVTASPPGLLVSGGGDFSVLRTPLILAAGDGVLNVTAQVATCDDSDAEYPACYLSRQDWGVPIRVGPDGLNRLELMLLG
jgi:thiol-disulfide isomerase/thioredoxin